MGVLMSTLASAGMANVINRKEAKNDWMKIFTEFPFECLLSIRREASRPLHQPISGVKSQLSMGRSERRKTGIVMQDPDRLLQPTQQPLIITLSAVTGITLLCNAAIRSNIEGSSHYQWLRRI
jgi:hypothetical protein